MDASLFENSPSGKLVPILGGEWDGHLAFVPNSLPPNLEWDSRFSASVSKADHALGVLSGIGENLPNPHLLIYPFIRKEAVLSSRIEGTQSTFSDLLMFEATSREEGKDVKEVFNYVRAMEHGLERSEKLPMSLRLIREIHGILMEGVRGEDSKPGEFRREPNWIGAQGCQLSEATFVPPPVPQMYEELDKFERFLHTDIQLPPLVQLAMIHYQFEAIHPFLDGNGRIGRLLIVFFLCQRRLLSQPLLYISAFLERNHQAYYDYLLGVSQKGAWRQWIAFFLDAVTEQSIDAVERSRRLLSLQDDYRRLVQDKQLSPTAQRLSDYIFERPLVRTKRVQQSLGISWSGANKAIQSLVDIEILTEITGRKRNRIYAAPEIMQILE